MHDDHPHPAPAAARRGGGLALGAVTITVGSSTGKSAPGTGSPKATGADVARQEGTDPRDQASATATAGPASWPRVDPRCLSAYVLVRAGQAVDVNDLVLTHHHGDHVGSAPAMAQSTPEPTFHAGAGAARVSTGADRVRALG